MIKRPSIRTVSLVWLGWAVIMLVYQVWVPARLSLAAPDDSLAWTAAETTPGSQDDKPSLNDPFLNTHVSWDSEFYLSIAMNGYEDPAIRRVGNTVGSPRPTGGFWPFVVAGTPADPQPGIPLSYAFFPFYPFLIRIVALPLLVFGLTPIATATLAGVFISIAGTLVATLALFELARQELGEHGGLRAAFYLLVFPSSFFLAQVYTEGLFVGLAFSSLVLIRRGRRGWGAVLAVLATMTRAAGVALVIPLLISWARDGEWLELDMEWRQIYFKGLPWKAIGNALVVLAPLLAFAVWRFSYHGMAFSRIEAEFFGRGFLSLDRTYYAWREALLRMTSGNSQAAAYYAVEILAIFLGFAACIAGLRRYPDLAWFGLMVVLLSFASGPAQGMHRYVLGAPPLFLLLGRLGRNPAFDRLWTLSSVLMMGIMATLFMFDMWAG